MKKKPKGNEEAKKKLAAGFRHAQEMGMRVGAGMAMHVYQDGGCGVLHYTLEPAQ